VNSVLDIVYQRICTNPTKPALGYLVDGAYCMMTYHDMGRHAEALYRHLAATMPKPGRIGIWAGNGWPWLVSDLAIQLHGSVSVPIYPTIGDDQLRDIFAHAKLDGMVIDAANYPRLSAHQDDLGDMKTLVYIAKNAGDKTIPPHATSFEVAAALDPAIQALTPELWQANRMADVMTILYTSGTTGIPKAVPLTHANIVHNYQGIHHNLPITSEDSVLSFLPLSHIFERTVGCICVLGVGATIYYAESIDTVVRDVAIAKPTCLISVPRLYEKVYQRVYANAQGIKGVVLTLALWIGQHQKTGWLRSLAHRAVFATIHKRLGNRVRFLVSGGAPLLPKIEVFFNAIGLPVIQGYGLTETSPIITANFDQRVGSVGKPLPNITVRIDDDGELTVKGPSVFSGYGNVPNDGVFTEDGYFKTGDLARIDTEGYVYITGRKKELIVLSNGKNVSPLRVEAAAAHSAFIQHIMVVGENHSYLVALVVPHMDAVFAAIGRSVSADDPAVQTLIMQDIQRYSRELAPFETIKKVAILSDDWGIDTHELTPTLKLRRGVIANKYRDRIDTLYTTQKKGQLL
jgi:long-chain acyl-CoA synthetase